MEVNISREQYTVLVSSIFKAFQSMFMNGRFDAVIFSPKSSKLNSRLVYCSGFYGS